MLLIIFVNKNAQHVSECTFVYLFNRNLMQHHINMVHEKVKQYPQEEGRRGNARLTLADEN